MTGHIFLIVADMLTHWWTRGVFHFGALELIDSAFLSSCARHAPLMILILLRHLAFHKVNMPIPIFIEANGSFILLVLWSGLHH